MAETLVQKIKNNAGKQWSRNTVADGNWLNSNTVQKFNENDETLANAIQEVSAAMEHFTPEITPSAWPCAANKTIQNIEQNADGSLNVTYQSIETSTTSDESLWSLYKHNAYDPVLAAYTEPEEDINHEAGELSENLTIPEGIYDVKVEVLYEPTQSTINNKLDIAISKSTDIADALYQTFILFDDSLIKDTTSNPQKIDVQSQWITGIINLTESTTLKFLIKGESAQGRYKLNNIYINSIGGAAGPEGPQGPAGPTGPTGPEGPTGPQGISLSAKSSTVDNVHTVEIWQEGASTAQTTFDVLDGVDGADGTSLSAKSSPITGGHRVELWEKGALQYDDSFNVMDGVDGASGTSIAAYSSKDNKTTTVLIYDPVNDPDHETPIDTFTVLDGADGTGTGDVTTQQLNAAIDGLSATVQNEYQTKGDYVTSAVNLFDTTHKYGLVKDNQGNVSWSTISEGSTYNFDNNTQGYHTLSGDGLTNPIGVNTDLFYKKTETSGASELSDEFAKYVEKTGDTMTGPLTVSVANGKNILGVSSAASIIGASRQTAEHFGQDEQAMGTTWMGVGSDGMYRGFLKYTQGGNVGDLNTNNTMQVEFTPNNKGTLFAKAKNNGSDCPETQILNPTKSSCDAMATSGNANLVSGPNYMLAKNADGQFTIGAAFVNCTDMNNVTLAPNTYYFVYEV